jgi:hypothetical protein
MPPEHSAWGATPEALGATTRKIIYRHKKIRSINAKIVAIDTCCHNLKIVASRGNK